MRAASAQRTHSRRDLVFSPTTRSFRSRKPIHYEVEAGKTIEIKLVSKPDTHVLDYFADLRSVDTNLSDDLKKVRIDLDRDNNKLKITGLEPTGRDDVMILASLYKDRVDESSDFGDVSPLAYIKVTPGTVTKAYLLSSFLKTIRKFSMWMLKSTLAFC